MLTVNARRLKGKLEKSAGLMSGDCVVCTDISVRGRGRAPDRADSHPARMRGSVCGDDRGTD
jgi:hypothetical protein